MKTTKKFEQKQAIAFSILLWIFTLEVFGCIVLLSEIYFESIVLNKQQTLLFIAAIIILNLFFIRWMNHRWFNTDKIFCKAFDHNILCKIHLSKIDDICKEIKDKPESIYVYMEQWGYTSVEGVWGNINQEKRRLEDIIQENMLLIEELRKLEPKTFNQYAKTYFWL